MIKSWSFSRLKVFEQCPYRAQLQYMEKRPDTTDHTAADRGTMVHDACEKFVKGEGEIVKEMYKFGDYFRELQVGYDRGLVQVEEDWGFDIDWQETDYWGDDIWLRMKLDNAITECKAGDDTVYMTVTDYKTGKKFGNEVSHNQQGVLYTLGTFMKYPKVDTVDVEVIYLDHGLVTKKSYTREKIMKFFPMWDKRGKAMTTATEFPPKPNAINCRWCPYGTNKGDGSCEWGVDI